MRRRKFEKTMLETLESRRYGKYRALVNENQDPEGLGRLQVIVAGVLGETPVWAMPCVPFAGPEVGMFFLPEKDSLVWVEFEGGDLCYPIWTGCFWKPKELTPGTPPSLRFIKTKEFAIEFDDDAGTLTISANGGGAKLVITRNQVQIDAAGDITSTVGGRKTALNVKKFDVHDGTFEVT